MTAKQPGPYRDAIIEAIHRGLTDDCDATLEEKKWAIFDRLSDPKIAWALALQAGVIMAPPILSYVSQQQEQA